MIPLALAVESLFSRLSSPVPLTKLLVANQLGALLANQETAMMCNEALLRELREARFESEVTELLVIPLVARELLLGVDALRVAIKFPSVLSDSILSMLNGRKLLISSWLTGHSGPAPKSYSTESLKVLRQARIVEPLIGYRLETLEGESRLPYLAQWCFEFDSLALRVEEEGSSSFMHFSRGDHDEQVGKFFSIESHRARSAYLRTLAIAAERWGMPVQIAEYLAEGVTPADSRLLGFGPARAPDWSNSLESVEFTSEGEYVERIKFALVSIRNADETILHADLLVQKRKTFAAELEVVTAFSERSDVTAEEVFSLHDEMPGRWSYEIVDPFAFVTSAEAVPGGKFVLAAIPLSNDHLGLFNSDLASRLPYLPRRFAKSGELRTRSASCQIEILSTLETIGRVNYWNRDWSPTHHKHLKPSCGVATTVASRFVSDTEAYSRKKLRTFWRLRLAERQKDYSSWHVKKLFGETE